MSLDRSITIRVATNHNRFSDLFIDFVTGFWIDEPEFGLLSLDLNDLDDFNFREYKNVNSLKPILDTREIKGIANYISFPVVKFEDSYSISSIRKAICTKAIPLITS